MECQNTNLPDTSPTLLPECCVQCPLHCCKNGLTSTPATSRLEVPKQQTGLYGQIGHLKLQIENLKKLHQKEKDVLVQQMECMETKHSMTLKRMAEMSSKNRWLENRMHFMTDVLVKGCQSAGSLKQRNGHGSDANLRPSAGSRGGPSPLRRSRSQELPSAHRLPRLSRNLSNCSQEEATKLRGKAQGTFNGAYEGIANPLASNGQMAPIQEIDEDVDWVKERDQLVCQNKRLDGQVRQLDKQRRCLESDLQEARDQLELLEFRILELEQGDYFTAKEANENCSFESVDVVSGSPLQDVSLFSSRQLDVLRVERQQLEAANAYCWPSFREEKLEEIQSKVLDIVRNRASVSVTDKTTLVQAIALLDICHKLILENRIKSSNCDQIDEKGQVFEVHSVRSTLLHSRRENKESVLQGPSFTDHLSDESVQRTLKCKVETSSCESDVLQLVDQMDRLKLEPLPTEKESLVQTANRHSDEADVCVKCQGTSDSTIRSHCVHCLSDVDASPPTANANVDVNRRAPSNSLATEFKELTGSQETTNGLHCTRGPDWGTRSENRNEIYDRLMEALSGKQMEMKNKETEYALKLEALKYEREEVVGRLENRLTAVQQRELHSRKELDAMVAEKASWRELSDARILDLELEREGLIRQLDTVRRDLERAYRKLEEFKSQDNYDAASKFVPDVDPEALQAKVDELKRQESQNRQRIRHLESRWKALRSQLAAASSESRVGGGGGDDDYDQEVRSSDDEAEELLARVSEALGTESKLRQRISQLEKKESAYRETLDEADRIVAEVEHSYQERMDEMEHSEQRLRQRITQLEQSEAHRRQALNFSSTKRDEVNKVGELMERVMEAEAVETRLRERLAESERREEELKATLVDIELARRQAVTLESQEQEEFLRKLDRLKHTEQSRQKRIEELEASESALQETLRNADDILATRERGLQETIAQLRTQLIASCAERLTKTKMNAFSWEEVDKMSAELQNLSGWEVGFHSLKEQLKGISGSIMACSRCQTHVGPSLGHLETQMRQLHEIVFGSQVTSIDFQLMTGHSNRSSDAAVVVVDDEDDNGVRRSMPVERSANLKEIMMKTNKEVNDNYKVERKIDDSQTEIFNELQSKVDWLETQLSQRGREMWAADQEISMLQTGLKERERNYEDKCSEMSSLAQQTSRLHEENEELRRKLWKAEVTHKVSMDKASKKASDLEAKAAALAKQLRTLENVQHENESTKETLNNVQNELKKKREMEHRLCAENLHLHHKAEALRERVSSLQLLKRDHKSLLTKQSALEKKLAAAELALGPLNNQISGLRRDCWDKERVIGRLSAEIRKTQILSPDSASFLLDHRKLVSQSSSQSSDDSGIKDCSVISNNGRESEMSEDSVLTDISSQSDDVAHTLRTSSPVGSSTSSSLSSEANDFSVSPQPDHSKRVGDDATVASASRLSTSTTKSRIPRYTALKSPTSSDTGSLKESISRTSSQSSLQSFGGRSVRSEHRRTTSKTTNTYTRRSRYNSTSSSDSSCCVNKKGKEAESKTVAKSVSTDKSCYATSKSSIKVKLNHFPPNTPSKAAAIVPKGIPDAPTNFHVTRKVGQDGLLVAWNIPSMDSSGCSNGVTVSGYQILVNNLLHQKVRSAHRTKALLNNLDLRGGTIPMEIAIQTSSITGQQSSSVITRYTGDEDLPPPKVSLSKFVWAEGGMCNGGPGHTTGKSGDAVRITASHTVLSRLVEV